MPTTGKLAVGRSRRRVAAAAAAAAVLLCGVAAALVVEASPSSSNAAAAAGAGTAGTRSAAPFTGSVPLGLAAGTGPYDALPPGGLPAGGPSRLVVASPSPGSRTASVSTQISLLGAAADGVPASAIRVVGSKTGTHAGRVEAYSTGNGESFLPFEPFAPGERVTVTTSLDIAGAPTGSFSFRVGNRLRVPGHQALPTLSTSARQVEHFASAPGVEPPLLDVRTGAGSTGGDIFLAPKGRVGAAGPEIVDAKGNVVWFRPLHGEEAFSFSEQQLHGRPVLAWFQGVVVDGHGEGEDVVASTRYRTMYVIAHPNGFQPDLHELQILPDGIALVTSYQALHWDLKPVGGAAHGLVWDGIAQEIDLKTGLVEYEWHSLDHVGVALSVLPAPSVASDIWDYFHINSLQQLSNGDLLVSSRNASAAYEIAPTEAGKVVWELGGRLSSFRMGSGTTFWLQHDVELPAPGIVTIFDDEAFPVRERNAQSRALVERLDYADMTATLVKSFEHAPPLLGAALGNVQTLGGGNLFVAWGTTPWMSEYSASGKLLYDAALPVGDDTYRAYRDTWNASPPGGPSLALSRAAGGEVLDVSWNGATAVASWRVLTGTSAGNLGTTATVPKVGFQTAVPLRSTPGFVKVEALSASGAVLGSTSRSLTVG